MKNQKGVTLIELLVTIVLLGIIVIPFLTLMTDAFTNTVSQGKETQIIYYAQEVIEEARIITYPEGLEGVTIYGTCTTELGCSEIDPNNRMEPILTDTDILYKLVFSNITNVTSDLVRNKELEKSFYEIKVIVESTKPNPKEVEFVTVVKKQ
ncbi:prepilin-type N-terminal cleavage/methylation domain-containing protein [Alkalihalobacillus sp. BA299]|uniref:type IV pilus modification PilV family protein n=1 Tax=Alkalihalobacillus sp. BA299 TaxID=2815938 RepID=UPI001AD9F430|nr:type II secretion system protein [Alkalihalobacillus sp. BA299]